MADKITSITSARDLGDTPAIVNRDTGEVIVNQRYWSKLSKAQRLYILLHEQGHIVNDSSDELAADQYASEAYTRMGYPLTESVKALTRILNRDNPESWERVQAQFKRAADYDCRVNGNKKACRYA